MKRKTRRGPSIELIVLMILCVTTITGVAGWGYTGYRLKGSNEDLKKNIDLVEQMQKEIQDLDSSINNLEEKMGTIEEGKATLQSEMSDLKTQKESLEGEKTGLETELDNVKSQLEDLKKQIDSGQVSSGTYFGKRPEKIVAITFDDGPGPYTERLLEELKARNVKATFFVLGNRAEKRPEIMQRMVADGHEIGNHSYDHTTLTNITEQEATDNLLKSTEAIYNATGGTRPQLMRPPGGNYNDMVKKICKENDWSITLWTLDTRDWASRDKTAILDEIFNEGQNQVKDGSILLMHDIYEVSIDASLEAIDRLKAEGYTLVTVSELLHWKYEGAEAGVVYN